MPHLWDSKVVVTKDELVPRFFTTEENLIKTVYRYKDKPYGLKKIQGGGKGRVLLIDFETLDIEIRNALGDPRRPLGGNWLDKFYELDAEAVKFFSAFRFENGIGLNSEKIEECSVNASVLKACNLLKVARERERISKRGSVRGVPTTIWKDAMNFQEILKAKHNVQHTLPANERRFLESWKKFGSDNYASLIKYSTMYTNVNALKVTSETISLLNNMFAGVSTKPTPVKIARQYSEFLLGKIKVINLETAEEYNPDDFPAISPSTITAYLGKWENRIGTWQKRAGNRPRYMNDFKIYAETEKTKFAGSLLSIDDRNPPFRYRNEKGKLEKVWFYIGVDAGSDAWVCWVHGKSKSGLIVDFYRQLLRTYKKHGLNASYELECESALNSSFKDGFLREGVLFERVRIEKNNPTGKIVENYIHRIKYSLENELDGYTPRPHAKLEPNQALTDKNVVLPYNVIVEQVEQAMLDWNNQPHHSGCGLTRWEYYMQKQHESTIPINWDIVLPTIGEETKTSCRNGTVRVNNVNMVLSMSGSEKLATGEDLINLMKRIEGEDLLVYWLDDENGDIIKAVAYIDDRYVCDLVQKPKFKRAALERTEQCEINYQLMSSYSNTVESFGRKQKNSIEKVILMKAESMHVEKKPVEILPPIPDDNYMEAFEYSYSKTSFLDRF